MPEFQANVLFLYSLSLSVSLSLFLCVTVFRATVWWCWLKSTRSRYTHRRFFVSFVILDIKSPVSATFTCVRIEKQQLQRLSFFIQIFVVVVVVVIIPKKMETRDLFGLYYIYFVWNSFVSCCVHWVGFTDIVYFQQDKSSHLRTKNRPIFGCVSISSRLIRIVVDVSLRF